MWYSVLHCQIASYFAPQTKMLASCFRYGESCVLQYIEWCEGNVLAKHQDVATMLNPACHWELVSDFSVPIQISQTFPSQKERGLLITQ